MQKKRKKGFSKWMALVLTAVMTVALFPAPALGADSIFSDDIVILFTGDVHGQADENLGYAGLAAYRNEKLISSRYVTAVDAGDAVSGTMLASVSKGSYVVKAMNLAGYSMAVPGVHEFDYGISHFRNTLTAEANYPYISCNFVYASNGASVFSPYRLMNFGTKLVAFVGISDPLTASKSAAFKKEEGSSAFGFSDGKNGQELYEKVQAAIDQARRIGADYVIAVGHLPYTGSSPYSPASIIKNTAGINAFIQGGSHAVTVGEKVTDKDGTTVLVSSAGSGLKNIGQLVISENETITASMLNSYSLRDIYTRDGIETLKTGYNAELVKPFASTSSRLEATDASGNRTVDKKETNLGDLCADAYRAVSGADVALVESQEIRGSLPVGDISYKDITKVFPSGRPISVMEVSGADLMDALEMSARLYPNQNSGFLQVSGLTYDIQETIIPSVSVDILGNFTGISGEYRVTNVMVQGKELDLFGTYTVAGTDRLLSGDTGYTMFENGKLKESIVSSDNQAVISYIANELKGSVGSLYAKSQGRMDAIRLARQSELDLEIAKKAKEQAADLGSQVEALRKELEAKNQIIEVKDTELTLSGKYGKSSGKRYIQLNWKVNRAVKNMKYQVWKSTKKSGGFARLITTSKLTYKNSSGLTKGKTYYYKVRGCKSISGKTYYTHWSEVYSKKVTS